MKSLFWIFIGLSFSFKIDYVPFNEIKPSLTLVAPLRSELSVTGSFGELRTNHFHAGIDLRSGYGLRGDDILSAADGYVSKIIIDSDNYGKSMYVSHPNGMITVYGHLNGFRQDIADNVKQQQYAKKSFKVELNYKPTDFPVKAGELIAYMGNTGASRGKHLHFELRNAANDEVLDPVEYGLPLKDDIKPTIRRIKVYGYDGEGEEVSSKVFSKSMIDKMHSAISIPGNVFSVGLDALDRCDYSRNYIGIKYIKLFIDGGLFYQFSADKWKRDETKYINAHIDYFAKNAKGQFHRCFVLSGNKMNLYHSLQNDGFFNMSENTEHQVKLIAGDANGNESEISFKIRKSPFTSKLRASRYADVIYHDLEKSFSVDRAELKYPAGSIYEDLNCELRTYSNPLPMSYSDWVCVYPSNDPVHLPAQVRLKADKKIPEHLRNKCFLAIKRGKSVQSIGGAWEGEFLVSKARSLGPFCIMVDTVAPGLKPLLNRRKKFAGDQISFRISDNIGAVKELPDIYYEASIDGKWVLMEYDKKSGIIRHKFEDWLTKGSHHYEIIVKDQLGNQRTYKGSFVS
jgi:hypothetical protein